MNSEQVQSEKDADSIFCRFNGLSLKIACILNIYMYEQHFK